MKVILTKIVFVFSFLLSINGISQSLEQMIDIALQNNYQIKIAKNEAQITSNNNEVGNTGMLPSILVDGGYSLAFNNTLQRFADGSTREGDNALNTNLNMSGVANWTAFNGFSVHVKKAQLGYIEQLGALNTKFYIEQTVADIVLIYHQLLYQKLMLNNFIKMLQISAYRLKLEEKKKKIGTGKSIEYGQALVDFQTDSIRFLTQKNNLRILEIELNRILINDLENKIDINENLPLKLDNFNKQELINDVEKNNNQLEQQRLQELISETEVRLAKANFSPKIDFFAGYRFTQSFSEVGFFQTNRNSGPVFGVNVNFNLFNGGANQREVKNNFLQYENTTLAKKDINKNIKAEILKLFNEYQSVNERIELAKNNINVNKNVFEIAQQQFQSGTLNGFDFRMTQLSLLQSELQLMELQFLLKNIEINLHRYSGNILLKYL